MDQNPNLRIHVDEDLTREERLRQRLNACCPEAQALAQQFETTTGWVLNYGVATPPGDLMAEHAPTPVFGRFEISDMSAKWPPGKPAVNRAESEKLLGNINRLMARIERLELAQHQSAGTLIEANEDSPLIPTNLSDKVANLLRFAKQEFSALGAAVYLLDEATTHLRLRSMIAPVSFAPEVESVRALENSLADLESLIGNKINIHSREMGETWKIPKPFQFGWCVVLGTKNLPLGTIWIFFSQARTPSDKELEFLEGLNNQLHSEISSREKPQTSDAETALLQQELLLAARSNDARLPSFSPEIDGWKITGWTYRQGYLSSTFHDWAITPAGNLSVAVGQVTGPMLTSSMSLNNLRSLVSAHREYRHTSQSMAAKLNEQIWCQSPGDEMASLIYALIDPETDRIDLVNAGDGGVVFSGPRGVYSVDQFQSPLGVDLDSTYERWEQVVQESETIVMFSQGLRHAISESMPSANDADLIRSILLTHPGHPHAILAAIEERFFSSDFQHVGGDLSVVVLARSTQAPDVHQVAAEVSHSILAELRAEEGDLLEALVKRIENPDQWSDLPYEASGSEIDADDFDEHWSQDDSTFGVIDEDDRDAEPAIEPASRNVVPAPDSNAQPEPSTKQAPVANSTSSNSGKTRARKAAAKSKKRESSPPKNKSARKSKHTAKEKSKEKAKAKAKAKAKVRTTRSENEKSRETKSKSKSVARTTKTAKTVPAKNGKATSRAPAKSKSARQSVTPAKSQAKLTSNAQEVVRKPVAGKLNAAEKAIQPAKRGKKSAVIPVVPATPSEAKVSKKRSNGTPTQRRTKSS
jgi:serine phosphatase RsbU (regulator of sigma subunit)